MALKVLILGGAGFLGSHVTDRAMREGFDVYVVDSLQTGRPENLSHHVGHPRFHFLQHNIANPFPPQILALKFHQIFHLACPASPVHYQADPIGTTMTCVNGTNHVLQLALASDCPVLITSTSEVYGDPEVHPQPEGYWGNVNCTGIRSCYDEGKRCAEALCFDYNRLHNVKIRVARIFNTYGPRMCFNDGRIISNFLVQALRGEDITVYGTGDYTRSFQYCDDLVEGFWRLVNHPTETGPVNLGNPEEYTVLDMAKKAQELVPGTASKIIFLPAAKDDPKQRKPDITKAKSVLGWEPTITVADGLQRTLAEFASRLASETTVASKVYIQCNPLLDISAHVSSEFLAKYNVTPAAAALVAPEQMGIYGDLESQKGCTYIPGGSGLNTARVAQWIAQAPAQSLVSYVGCVADDKYGSILKSAAETDGVKMLVEYAKGGTPTGTCAVCITGKERSLVANLAAANLISGEHLKTDRVISAIQEAKIFYLTGFTLTINVDYVVSVAKKARAVGGKFMMNLSAPFIIQFFGEQLEKVLPYVDVLFSNDDEAKVLAQVKGWNTDDVESIAKLAAALPYNGTGSRLVVFTQGSKPSVWATTTATGQVAVDPIDAEKIIDTNGAGDAFVGGYLAAAAFGRPVEKCIAVGNYAAGVIIQHDGCTFPAKPTITL
ncbi:dTDP-glucose 4,6-dehydratase, putative [Bodo saltans]|uniref:Adenosine kinase n=1 Tax=Bodo saltans TaxID=75058 RepID=A0A0S4J3A6_BODSA|nr:dTDP-glucose 4,6-dehydratase, putative [Bodo saltans]|eukprot:CUG69043.1 dTDP-glucose 4,6-dehydratase, putative [Bodo saltans]